MKKMSFVGLVLLLVGCSGSVQYNDGEKVSLQSDAWVGLDRLQKDADAACQQFGKPRAIYQHSSNMETRIPKGYGAQNTLWKCTE